MLDKAGIDGAALEAIEIRDLLKVVERVAAWRNLSLRGWRCALRLAGNCGPFCAAAAHDFAPLLRMLRGKIEPDGP